MKLSNVTIVKLGQLHEGNDRRLIHWKDICADYNRPLIWHNRAACMHGSNFEEKKNMRPGYLTTNTEKDDFDSSTHIATSALSSPSCSKHSYLSLS